MSIEVIDNLVPGIYANQLEGLCTSKEFPWYLDYNVSGVSPGTVAEGANLKGSQHGFFHMALNLDKATSPYFDKFFPLMYFMEEKTGVEINDILRIRVALTTSIGTEVQHYPHIDSESPHKVLLYYVNDSDGDTFMYNEMHTQGMVKPSSYTLNQRVTPKKGRAVLFDGLRYHSSSKPVSTSARFIVNINFV